MIENNLRGTKVYCAGNLENENWQKALSWRESLKQELSKIGIVCLSPLDKVFKNFEKEGENLHTELKELIKKGDLEPVHQKMKSIRRRDLALIDRSDFVVCVLDVQKPTFGTIEELVLSEKQSKPVFIVVKGGAIPLWLLAMFKPKYFYDSLEDVIIHLKKLDNGELPITDENWRIFEDKYL
jgi:nucleoside 2-deoxyribosyltransferase